MVYWREALIALSIKAGRKPKEIITELQIQRHGERKQCEAPLTHRDKRRRTVRSLRKELVELSAIVRTQREPRVQINVLHSIVAAGGHAGQPSQAGWLPTRK